jgi:hypothetical protein
MASGCRHREYRGVKSYPSSVLSLSLHGHVSVKSLARCKTHFTYFLLCSVQDKICTLFTLDTSQLKPLDIMLTLSYMVSFTLQESLQLQGLCATVASFKLSMFTHKNQL